MHVSRAARLEADEYADGPFFLPLYPSLSLSKSRVFSPPLSPVLAVRSLSLFSLSLSLVDARSTK